MDVSDANTWLEEYQYSPLTDPSTDIRLIQLLPGQPNEDIRLRVFQTTLEKSTEIVDTRLSPSQLQDILPEPWRVRVTVEGRYIFQNLSIAGPRAWQWTCPAREVPPSSYTISEHEIAIYEPEYEALSYTWGTIDSGSVIVEESSGVGTAIVSKRLKARTNLLDALKHLRTLNSSRILWIDSICINQDDEREKANQIKRMGNIYSSANRVVVWLGAEADASNHALEVLRYVGGQTEYLKGGTLCPSPGAIEEHWDDVRTKLPYGQRTWDAIFSLLYRHWFERVWVIQEALLANSYAQVQCGHAVVTFVDFRRAATCIKENQHSPPGLTSRLRYLAKITNPSTGLPFDRVLRLSYGRRCTNPRDYIYGVLALTPKKLAAKIWPDYTLSVVQVFTETTLLHASHSQRLELIQRACQSGRLLHTPSWVPDLTGGLARKFPCNGQFSAGYSRAHFKYQAPNILDVLGIQCAVINAVSSLRIGDDEPISIFQAWQSQNTSSGSFTNNSKDLHAHLVTLRKGRTCERWIDWQSTYPSFRDWERAYQYSVQDDAGLAGKDSAQFTGTNKHIRQAADFCAGHAYVWTDEGHAGLVPLDTQTGDVVCVLLGCDSPIVLRESAPGRFIVIGECFFQDLSDAISILGSLPPPWKVQMFKNYGNRYRYCFFNPESNEITDEDPRLGSLENWERIEHEPEADDPHVYDYFRHKQTEEVINSDPRMLPDALYTRGVSLEWFSLI